jgi:hypothetical protein
MWIEYPMSPQVARKGFRSSLLIQHSACWKGRMAWVLKEKEAVIVTQYSLDVELNNSDYPIIDMKSLYVRRFVRCHPAQLTQFLEPHLSSF